MVNFEKVSVNVFFKAENYTFAREKPTEAKLDDETHKEVSQELSDKNSIYTKFRNYLRNHGVTKLIS